jgi:hypothetical protein
MSLSSPDAARRHPLHRFRHLGAAALAVTGALVALSGCSTTFPVPTPPASTAALINNGNDGLLIPLQVERADQGHARLGLPVQIDGKPVYLALDTGTQGVRVLKSVLPAGAIRTPARRVRCRSRTARRFPARRSRCRSASRVRSRRRSTRRRSTR